MHLADNTSLLPEYKMAKLKLFNLKAIAMFQ